MAYPCFCSKEELEDIRNAQEKRKDRIGYYGRYAKCRKIPVNDAYEKIKNGEPFTLRLKSPGDFNKKIIVKTINLLNFLQQLIGILSLFDYK